MRWLAAVVAASLALAAVSSEVVACGCFAPPGPASPVVQAGERIIFGVKNGQVTAHIQIQYSGRADEFGWLLPLPSVPTVGVGSKELFDELERRTAPTFQVTQSFPPRNCYNYYSNYGRGSGGGGGFGCGTSTTVTPLGGGCEIDSQCGPNGLCVQRICIVDFREDLAAAAPPDFASVAVVADSIGPYDYAVLKADDKTAMLDWLKESHFYVPAGTDDVLAPYIHPGAYFLALKLRSGNDAGDIQPVVVQYTSDLPMIPLILTAVGAVPDMNVEAWVLGTARAVPRNYYHAVLDEAAVWVGGTGYGEAFKQAVHAAPRRHAFVTEYAGPTPDVRSVLDVPLVDEKALSQLADPKAFWDYLRGHGLMIGQFAASTTAVLSSHLEEPQSLVEKGITEANFYRDLGYWLDYWKKNFPNDPPIEFDAVATAADLMARVVNPPKAALAMFEGSPYLTRLRTVLSPEDMTDDPVFSFNPSLPQVPAARGATLETTCYQTSYLLDDPVDPTGAPQLRFNPYTPGLPAALRIELLREEGPPEVLTDNLATVRASTVAEITDPPGQAPPSEASSSGCAVVPAATHRGMLATLALLGAAALILRARRHRRRR